MRTLSQWSLVLILMGGVHSAAWGEDKEFITLKRLKMPVLESWTLTVAKEKSNARDFISTKFPGKALLRVYNPVTFKDSKNLTEHLARAVGNINHDRKTLKSFPTSFQSTLEGFPVAIQGEVTEDKKGSKRFTLSFGIATGKSMQVVTLFARDMAAFQGSAKEIGEMVEKTKVVFPHANPTVRVLLDKAPHDSILIAKYRRPPSFKAETSRDLHMKKYTMSVPLAGVPKPVPFSVRVALYPALPENSKLILTAWLLGTDFDLKAGKNDKSKMNQITDFKVKTSQRYSVGSLQTYRGQQVISNRYGIMVYGRHWTLCLGAVMGEGRAIRGLSDEQKQAAFQAFVKKVVPTLFAVAQSVEWSSEKMGVRADLRAALIKKKKYHYHYHSSSSITNSTIEKYRYWTFRPDSCDSDGNTFFYIAPDATTDGLSGMVSSKNFKRAGFRVLEWKKQNLLIVKKGRFFGSVHTIEMNKTGSFGKDKVQGFAIDGKIEGRYSDFDTGKSWLPAPSEKEEKK